MDDEEVVTSGLGSDVSAGGLQHGRQAEDRRIILMN
jgi:hypothetical protein